MARLQRSVRLDPELLATLERLARDRVVPVTFAEQVDAGLRLLVVEATDKQLRAGATRLAADHDRARAAYHQLHQDRR